MQSAAFELDRRRPAALQVFEHLRDRIVAMELKPGESLSRAALADHYKVSQTPIRDAIMRLEQDGLVEIYPQSRTLVTRIDIEQARETQFLRKAIEIEIARLLAAEADKTAIVDVRRTLVAQCRAIELPDGLAEFMRLDRRFHEALYVAAGREGLWRLVIDRSGHIDRLRRLHLPSEGKAKTICADHETILRAIEASDPHAAGEAVRTHLSGTLEWLDEAVRRRPDYF